MEKLLNVALIMDVTQAYDRKVIEGVASYLHETHHWCVYLEESPRQRSPDLRRWKGDGIIAHFDDRRLVESLQRLRIPVVDIGGGYGWYDPASGIPYFTSNEKAIARLAADHLLERGFTRLAYCGYPCIPTNKWSSARAEAFAKRAAQAGCTCDVFTGRHHVACDWDAMQRELTDWLASLSRPVGLMACNDVRARHVLEACRLLGLRVPDDVAVVGVDNNEMMCELSAPPLTSVEQGLRRMGYEAAALLDRLMAGEKPRRRRYVYDPIDVVTRRSTDVLAVDDPEVAAAVHCIQDRACEGIGVPDVADAVGISRSTLERKYEAATGRTVYDDIRRIRIERARQLLLTTNLPLKQVAARSGFKYVTYLSAVFCRHYGCTPAKWREQARCRGAAH